MPTAVVQTDRSVRPKDRRRLKKPSMTEPRLVIDIHAIADYIFGSSSMISPKGMEMEWRGDEHPSKDVVVGERDGPEFQINTPGRKQADQFPSNLVYTSSRHLAMVLGKTVDVAINAVESGSKTYDCTILESLIENMKKERQETSSYYDDEICLTLQELRMIVMRLIDSARESVYKGTKAPTGICLSNFGAKRCCLDLFWGKPDSDEVAVRASMNF